MKMNKKNLFLIIIVLLVLPIIVDAKATPAKISISVELEGDSIEKYDFLYELQDLEGNIIQTKRNNAGSVTFDNIEYQESDIGKTYYYIVKQKNESKEGLTYDDSTVYVGVEVGENETQVHYVKPSMYKKKEYHPFHATEEELRGEAYAVYDIDTKTLTFFRDEPNKYTNQEVIDNKVYFADFETKDYFDYWIYNQYSYQNIEKIVFQDAVKPKSIRYWFQEMPNLKEMDIRKLDTSLVTTFMEFLHNCSSLRNLDISTMDVSNVVDFTKAFKYSGIEELDFTIWNLEHLKGTRPLQEFVNSMPNLKYLNISNFEGIDSSAEFANLPCLEYVHLGNKFKFNNSALDTTPPYFLKLEDYNLYSSIDLHIPYNVEEGTIGGHYVRPTCTNEASFRNIYKKHEKEDTSIVIQNPPTKKNIIFIMISIVIVALGICYIKKNIDKKI